MALKAVDRDNNAFTRKVQAENNRGEELLKKEIEILKADKEKVLSNKENEKSRPKTRRSGKEQK